MTQDSYSEKRRKHMAVMDAKRVDDVFELEGKLEAAEAKLAKAVATLTALADMKTSGDGKSAVAMAWHAREVLNKIKGMDQKKDTNATA